MSVSQRILFIWDNFGPLHADRCEAVALEQGPGVVFGIELSSTSADYDWNSVGGRDSRRSLSMCGRSPWFKRFPLSWRQSGE